MEVDFNSLPVSFYILDTKWLRGFGVYQRLAGNPRMSIIIFMDPSSSVASCSCLCTNPAYSCSTSGPDVCAKYHLMCSIKVILLFPKRLT